MIYKAAFPRTHEDLVRALSRMDMTEFDVVEPVTPEQAERLAHQIKDFAQRGDNVTLILVRSS
jgi:N-acetylglucosamine kinase-like BadF-type ATPase